MFQQSLLSLFFFNPILLAHMIYSINLALALFYTPAAPIMNTHDAFFVVVVRVKFLPVHGQEEQGRAQAIGSDCRAHQLPRA